VSPTSKPCRRLWKRAKTYSNWTAWLTHPRSTEWSVASVKVAKSIQCRMSCTESCRLELRQSIRLWEYNPIYGRFSAHAQTLRCADSCYAIVVTAARKNLMTRPVGQTTVSDRQRTGHPRSELRRDWSFLRLPDSNYLAFARTPCVDMSTAAGRRWRHHGLCVWPSLCRSVSTARRRLWLAW